MTAHPTYGADAGPPGQPAQPGTPASPVAVTVPGNPAPSRACQRDGGAGPTPRTFTLELPAGMKVLSLNQRLHWAQRHAIGADLKKAAWAMAISRRVPHLERASLIVEYQPPDKRHRDADNVPAASGKFCIDGIVAAGVLSDDESPRYVTDIRYRLGPVCKGGRLVLHITEVAS